ncbi:hypothetical protein Phum_PHUM417660 [Pediculus humanus corporis]|uniref:Uncharacterized protein n=1 Tax=Pediculus humanus subsp. corporis TaxID=121224 RepID=E0VSF2_PEDHC|nr:uncharacterized protein Phum_PHUM417660 [Pediculus humanus corporis]EEB16308.1 hypothetical protein Phum_PHUM417660 [Pediculus humanus corporis]
MIKKCQNEIFNGLSDLENGKEVNKEIVKERTDALIDVYHILNNEIRDVIKTTIYQGIDNKMIIKKFECVGNNGNQTINVLYEIYKTIPEKSRNLIDESYLTLLPFNLTLNYFLEFLNDFKNAKEQEISNETTDGGILIILDEVKEKMETIENVLINVNVKMEDFKFEFFEKYVDFVHETENSLKTEQAKGLKKIQQCLNSN